MFTKEQSERIAAAFERLVAAFERAHPPAAERPSRALYWLLTEDQWALLNRPGACMFCGWGKASCRGGGFPELDPVGTEWTPPAHDYQPRG